jgi:hypothetical protein
MIVKLIESVKRIKNVVEIIATVQTEDGLDYLGICKFFLKESELLPSDEDQLCYFLEDLNLDWEECKLSFN